MYFWVLKQLMKWYINSLRVWIFENLKIENFNPSRENSSFWRAVDHLKWPTFAKKWKKRLKLAGKWPTKSGIVACTAQLSFVWSYIFFWDKYFQLNKFTRCQSRCCIHLLSSIISESCLIEICKREFVQIMPCPVMGKTLTPAHTLTSSTGQWKLCITYIYITKNTRKTHFQLKKYYILNVWAISKRRVHNDLYARYREIICSPRKPCSISAFFVRPRPGNPLQSTYRVLFLVIFDSYAHII